MANPVAGPMLQSAIAPMMRSKGGAVAIMPEGVDITRMLDSFPIDALIVAANEAMDVAES
ncbi:hypothetical protein BH09ACT8_BH09ACT8_65090 [soil metagenome]